jgi:NADH-quinone oxidoreductase subunit K
LSNSLKRFPFQKEKRFPLPPFFEWNRGVESHREILSQRWPFHSADRLGCQYRNHHSKRSMDLVKYLSVSMILFLLGIWGIFLNRKNIIIMLMSIELMLLAVNLNLLLFSVYLDDLIGQLFALLVLTVAAAESAIGLALLVVYYRVRGTIAVEFINLIKG